MWNTRRIPDILLKESSLFSVPAEDKLMAAIGNKLYRQTSTSRLEEAAAIDKQISRLEDDIRKLKIDFDIYFNGATKRPPLEARARLESTIKRVSDNRHISYAQRYQLNTIVSRFTSYRELWRRTLRTRGEELI
jgi:hypothetical protein